MDWSQLSKIPGYRNVRSQMERIEADRFIAALGHTCIGQPKGNRRGTMSGCIKNSGRLALEKAISWVISAM
jgi:hypothetical protein